MHTIRDDNAVIFVYPNQLGTNEICKCSNKLDALKIVAWLNGGKAPKIKLSELELLLDSDRKFD